MNRDPQVTDGEPEARTRLRLVTREPGPAPGKEMVTSAVHARKKKPAEPPPGESAVEWVHANAWAALLGATALAMLVARLGRSGR